MRILKLKGRRRKVGEQVVSQRQARDMREAVCEALQDGFPTEVGDVRIEESDDGYAELIIDGQRQTIGDRMFLVKCIQVL